MKDDIFHFLFKNSNKKKLQIKASKPVVEIVKNQLYIGRTPARICEIIGHRTGEELSIKDALDELGANESARKVFPLAATPGAHWIYFALFSTCRQNPGKNVLKKYLHFLDKKLGRKTAGVGRRLIITNSSNKKLRRQIERSRSVHDIRRRVGEMDNIIDKKILDRVNRLIQNNKKEKVNYKKLAKNFRAAWCRQSETLQSSNHSHLIKNKNPIGINDKDLLRIYAGYWIIRSLFGIEIRSTDGEEEDGRGRIIKLNSRIIRKSSRNSFYYLNRLFKKEPALKESLGNILDYLKDAKRTGEPPLIHEYYRRQAEGRRILNSFRLTRFWQVLNQLNEAASARSRFA
ncbi:MAG TPA: hypothetical protein PLP18_00445 [Smithellaceae bacterium]|nr:hypothetical protein [Smithellaceae bacterium]